MSNDRSERLERARRDPAERVEPEEHRHQGVFGGDARKSHQHAFNDLGNGTDVYTRAQYDAWVRFNAAICRFHGWGAGSCAGHLETSVEGKPDPRGPVEGYGRRGRFTFTMGQLRADVHERLAHAPSWSPPTAEEAPSMTTPDYVNLGLAHGVQLAPGSWDDVEFTTEWNQVMAAAAIGTVPVVIVFLFFQKQLMHGLTGGAVKG